ncbi:MAG: 2-oxo acid dehydrogenase subunit E2 [Actinomycetota bacterium]|nr:2-oxo acid dehydrogenase subunit E2 [Actinomycetota bacterium]
MAVEVKMPQLGETVTEGTILRWLKQPGDQVAEDEVLVEISTDKVDTEIPSPAAGVIQDLLVEEGETVSVGTAIATIDSDGAEGGETEAAAPAEEAEQDEGAQSTPPETEQAEEARQADAETSARETSEQVEQEAPPGPPATEQAPAARREPSGDGELGARAGPGEGMGAVLSPVVRRLAREHDVDLSRLQGSGQGGRITRGDVLGFLERREEAPAEAPAREAAPAAAAPPVEAPAEPAEIPLLPDDEVRDLDRLRVRVADNMIRSKRSAAHVWTAVEVDFERVERVRRRHKDAWKDQEGFSLTYLPFISRAAIDALNEYPVVNSSFYLEQRKAVFHRKINLGIGIDLEQRGLIVAVIKDADELRLVGLARGVREMAEKARGGKLEPDDISGSTFTITNPGPFGSFMSAPIINVPNVAILSTDTITKRPTVVSGPDGEDTIAIHHIGYLGLTWDHRAFDGSTAVLFLRRIKESLETWDWEQELA